MTVFAKVTLADVLADSGTVKTGPFGTVLKAAEYAGAGVPIISVGEVDYGSLRLRKDTPHAPVEVTERLPEYVLRAGDIVFGRKGAVDRSAWVKSSEDGWFLGSDGIRLRLPLDVNTRFFAYQFQNPTVREWLLQHASGSTMLSLNQRILERVPLVVPDREVQDAIAEVLGALDDKIAANTKLAETADDFLSTEFSRLESAFPVTQLLGAIADVNRSTIKPSSGGSLRYVDIASVAVGHYDFPEVSPWDEAPSRARRVLTRGDTIWSTVRPNRRSHALILSDDPLLVGSTGLAVLSPRDVGFAYLYEVTKRPEFTAYLETVAEGSAYPAVRADKFLAAPVPMLSLDRQEQFEEAASSIRLHIESLMEENRTLAATRDALLPQLMSGKLRVKDIETTMGEMV